MPGNNMGGNRNMKINRKYIMTSAVILLSVLFVFFDSMKHIIIPSLDALQSFLITFGFVIMIVFVMTYLVKKIYSIHNDQIRKKQSENSKLVLAMCSNEEMYNAVLENSPNAIVLTDGESLEKVYFNRKACEVLGYARPEFAVLEMKDYEASPFEDVKRRLERIALTGVAETYETRYRKKNGELIDVLVNVKHIPFCGKKYFLSIAEDVNGEKKRIQTKATEQYEFLNTLIETIPAPVFYKDRLGRYMGCNRAFEDFTGMGRQEILGRDVYGVSPKEIADEYFKRDEELFRNPGLQVYECRLETKKTGFHDVVLSKATFKDIKGNVAGIIGVILDITDRKKAQDDLQKAHDTLEQRVKERTSELETANRVLQLEIDRRHAAESSLRSSEERYRRITEGLTDYLYTVYVKDDIAIKTIHNRACEAVTGYTVEEFDQDPFLWLRMLPGEDREPVVGHVKKLLFGKTIQEFRHRLVRKDGMIIWVSTTLVPHVDVSGKLISYDGVIKDITEHKKVEDALRQSEVELKGILDTTADGILAVDNNGRTIRTNRRFADLWRIPKSLLDARDDRQMLNFVLQQLQEPEAFLEKVHALYGSTEEDRDTLTFKDGRVFERHSAPLIKDGSLIGRVWSFRDITERKRMEIQNRQLQKAESLDRMASAIAHLFNNNLHAVLGYLEMVIDDLPPDDSNVIKLAKAMQSAKKASEVSSLMLAYIGHIPSKLELIDLSETCRLRLPILQAGKPKNVKMEAVLPSPGPYVNGDAKQIQQLLANLIINAWEAIGDKAGTIYINVSTVSRKEIPSSHRFPVEWNSPEQFYGCLEVTDSGCGIQEEDMDKIFDPFFSTKFTGKGLGLSVVLGIVKAHDSVIVAERGINGGSVFKVFFPLSAQPVPCPKEKLDKSPDIVPGGIVLLVEDEEMLRKMTEMALVKAGFTVLQAQDGLEAVEIFRQHKDEISCLFCDQLMPRMDGWETIAALRSLRHDLPVILASGYEQSIVMARKHSELPDFFLNKPYNLNTLGDTIGQVIASKKTKVLS